MVPVVILLISFELISIMKLDIRRQAPDMNEGCSGFVIFFWLSCEKNVDFIFFIVCMMIEQRNKIGMVVSLCKNVIVKK